MKWCEQEFGYEQFNWLDLRWRYNSEGVFEFKNAADCEWFVLRWA
jgi:hypothetical protein